ncbi:hypothetical protein HK405_008777, partial [Cladochytrium tenue]
MSPLSLTDLPPEVVQGVLVWLHPHELLRLRRACRLLHDRLAPDPWRDGDGYVEDEDEGDGDDNEYEEDDGDDYGSGDRVANRVIETSASFSSIEAGISIARSPPRPPESLLTVSFAVENIRAFAASNRLSATGLSSLRWNALGPTYLAALFCDRGFFAYTLTIFAPWIQGDDNFSDDDESDEEESPEARTPPWGGRHRQLGLRDVRDYIQHGDISKTLPCLGLTTNVRRDPTAARIHQAVHLAARCCMLVSSLPGRFFSTDLGRWLAVFDDAETFTAWFRTARPGRARVDSGLHSSYLLDDVAAAGAASIVRVLIADYGFIPTSNTLCKAMCARSSATIEALSCSTSLDELRPSLALSPNDAKLLLTEFDPEIIVAILSVPGIRLDTSQVAEFSFGRRPRYEEDHTALPPRSRQRRAAMVRLAMERLVESGSMCEASMPALVRAACREGHADLVRRLLRTHEAQTRKNLPGYFKEVAYNAHEELLRHLIDVSSLAEDPAELRKEIETAVIWNASTGCLPKVACLLSAEDSLIGPFCLQHAANLACKHQHIEVWEYLRDRLGTRMGMKQAVTASDFVSGNQTLDLILVSDDFNAFRTCIPSSEVLVKDSLISIARRAASVGAANIVELLVDDFGVAVSEVLNDAIRSGNASLVRNLMSKVYPGTAADITVSTIYDFGVYIREILEAIVGVRIEVHHRAFGNFLRSEGENEGDNVFSRENREGLLARLIDAGSLDSVPAPLLLVEACMAGSLPMVKHILASPQLQKSTESTDEGFGSFANEFRLAVSEATTLPNMDILQELCRASRTFRGCAYWPEELVSAAKMGLVSAVQVMLDAAEPSEKRLKDIAGAFSSAKDEPTKDGNRDGQEAVIQLLRQLAASYVKDSKRINAVPEFGESQLETSFFLAVLISDDSSTLAGWLGQRTGIPPSIEVLVTVADRAATYGAVECLRTIARSPFHVRPSYFALSSAVGFLNADVVRVLAVELEVPPPARLQIIDNELYYHIRSRHPTALGWADLDDVLRQPVSHAIVDTLLALLDSPTFAAARPDVISWPGVA